MTYIPQRPRRVLAHKPAARTLGDFWSDLLTGSGTSAPSSTPAPEIQMPPMSVSGQALGCQRGQVSDPNKSVNGYAQCMPRANYTAGELLNPNVDPAVAKLKAKGTSPSAGSIIGSIIGALTGGVPALPTGLPAGTAYVPARSGMSSVTKLAIAAGAVGLVAVIATRK